MPLLLSANFFQKNFKKNSFRNTIRVPNGSDPDHNRQKVCSDLGPNCFLKVIRREQMSPLARKELILIIKLHHLIDNKSQKIMYSLVLSVTSGQITRSTMVMPICLDPFCHFNNCVCYKYLMRESRKFCQRGSNYDFFFCCCFFIYILMRGERIQIPL